VLLIDRAHRLMHNCHCGDEARGTGYFDNHFLGRHSLFAQMFQALNDPVQARSKKQAFHESPSNRLTARAGLAPGVRRL